VQALWRGKVAGRIFMNRLEEEIKERQGALAFMRNITDLKQFEKQEVVIQSMEREKSKASFGSVVGWMGHQLGNCEEVHTPVGHQGHGLRGCLQVHQEQ
jgi:hypothetical protein